MESFGVFILESYQHLVKNEDPPFSYYRESIQSFPYGQNPEAFIETNRQTSFVRANDRP